MKQPFGNSLSPHAERLERLEHTMPAANVHGLMALGRSFGWEQQGGANHQKEERDGEWTAHDGMAFACHSIAGTARAPEERRLIRSLVGAWNRSRSDKSSSKPKKKSGTSLFQPGGLEGQLYAAQDSSLHMGVKHEDTSLQSTLRQRTASVSIPPLMIEKRAAPRGQTGGGGALGRTKAAVEEKPTFVSWAVSTLRNMWLLDGKRAPPADSLIDTPSASSVYSLSSVPPGMGSPHGMGSPDGMGSPHGGSTSRSNGSSFGAHSANHGSGVHAHGSSFGGISDANFLPVTVVKGLHSKRLGGLSTWLALGGSPDATDPACCTALHYATLARFPEAVDLLISSGCDVNARIVMSSGGSTALLLASIRAYTEIVELLLFAGANPDIADADGHTPLMVASRAGDVELVRKLLSAGACTELPDRDSRTALWYAVKYEQKGAAILLRMARQDAVREGRIQEAKLKAAKAKAQIEAGAAVMAKGSAKEGEARGGVTSQRDPITSAGKKGSSKKKGKAHARM